MHAADAGEEKDCRRSVTNAAPDLKANPRPTTARSGKLAVWKRPQPHAAARVLASRCRLNGSPRIDGRGRGVVFWRNRDTLPLFLWQELWLLARSPVYGSGRKRPRLTLHCRRLQSPSRRAADGLVRGKTAEHWRPATTGRRRDPRWPGRAPRAARPESSGPCGSGTSCPSSSLARWPSVFGLGPSHRKSPSRLLRSRRWSCPSFGVASRAVRTGPRCKRHETSVGSHRGLLRSHTRSAGGPLSENQRGSSCISGSSLRRHLLSRRLSRWAPLARSVRTEAG